MVDIHCHLMPEVDDGAQSVEEAMDMARIAYESGTSMLIVTPHYNTPGSHYNWSCIELKKEFEKLCDSIRDRNIQLKLALGMEVFASEDIIAKILNGEVFMLNNSRYILVEFYMNDHPMRVNAMLEQIASLNLIPVIAHPERYKFIQNELGIALQWKNRGYLIQVNKGSVLGYFGARVKKTVCDMLRLNLVHAVASDGHSPYRRTPDLFDIYEYISDHYSNIYADDLLMHMPELIINNR